MPFGRVYCTRCGCQAFLTIEDWRRGNGQWQIDPNVTVIEGRDRPVGHGHGEHDVNGLPLEAEEAMAWAMYRAFEGADWASVLLPSEITAVLIDAVLSNLPAGVYVSDGQGHVTLVDGPFCSCAGAALAALSATDTEGSS